MSQSEKCSDQRASPQQARPLHKASCAGPHPLQSLHPLLSQSWPSPELQLLGLCLGSSQALVPRSAPANGPDPKWAKCPAGLWAPDPSLDSALRTRLAPGLRFTPFNPAFPRSGPTRRVCPKAAWEPLRGAGAPNLSRDRPAPPKSGPRSAGDYCVSFPSDRFIHSPGGRTQSHRQAGGRTKATHTHTHTHTH